MNLKKLVRQIRKTLTEVAEAAAAAEAYALEHVGADEGQALRIGLAADELAANALTHGAVAEIAPDIALEVWGDDHFVNLRVTASGPRFDPRDYRPVTAERSDIGGRGLALVLAFADQLSYAREGPKNITTFSVYRIGAADPAEQSGK
ncbi:MAG: ATP-binding protein [Pseudomonadota bacterium]